MIPFNKLKRGKNALHESLAFQTELKAVIGSVVSSVDCGNRTEGQLC